MIWPTYHEHSALPDCSHTPNDTLRVEKGRFKSLQYISNHTKTNISTYLRLHFRPLCVFSSTNPGVGTQKPKKSMDSKKEHPSKLAPTCSISEKPSFCCLEETSRHQHEPLEIRRSPFQPFQIGSLSCYLQGFYTSKRWLFFFFGFRQTINQYDIDSKIIGTKTPINLVSIELDVSHQLYFLHCPGIIISNIQLYVFIYCTLVSITRNHLKKVRSPHFEMRNFVDTHWKFDEENPRWSQKNNNTLIETSQVVSVEF